MKPIMLLSIVILALIILASSFGLHVMPVAQLYNLSDTVLANALYVCPFESTTFGGLSSGLRPVLQYINMVFFFAAIILMFIWGWALYQNLLADNFKADAFGGAWTGSKALFWAIVIVAILSATPNFYRSVKITGVPGNWTLCEGNTPGAKPVRASAVVR